MKKNLFLGILLSSTMVFAQTSEDRVTVKDMLTDDVTFEKVFPFADMKILQDRQIVKEILSGLYFQQSALSTPGVEIPKVTQGLYSEKDSEILEGAMNKSMLKSNLDEESFNKLLEKADEDPQGAFKELLLNSSFAKIKSEEMKNLNQVDKEAISKKMQIITESGPDIGAKPVPVLYRNETQE